MGDVLASKGDRDSSSHIAVQDKAEVRRWLRYFGVTKTSCNAPSRKSVIRLSPSGNKWASIARRSLFDSVQFPENLNDYKRCPEPSLLEASVSAKLN
jgi:hypothetical protein